jgi:hypothetical protein
MRSDTRSCPDRAIRSDATMPITMRRAASAFEPPREPLPFRKIQMVKARTQPEPKCPIRPGDACSLCLPGASGPQDCGLVYLVMSDPELRERLHHIRLASI